MNEYVERGWLLAKSVEVFKSYKLSKIPKGEAAWISQEFLIKKAPTADVVEVRHGHWIKNWCDTGMIGHEYAECSLCGCQMIDTNVFWDSKFCPHCGAQMKEEK